MTATEPTTENLPALPEPQGVDLTAPLGLPAPSEWAAMTQMAEVLSRSGLVPASLRRKPDDIILVLLTGRDLRIQPTVALQKIHIIEGKATASAELMTALVNRQPGMRIWPDPANDATKATAHGERDGEKVSFTFTEKDARTAGLTNKGTWKSYPQFMLWARAASGLCRMAFADVLCGVTYTPDEMGAEVNPETGEVITTTARQAPAPRPLPPEAVAKVQAGCDAAGFTAEDVEEMVITATGGRTDELAEVLESEYAALRDAKAAIVARKQDETPAEPVDDDLAPFAHLAPQVQAKVDKLATVKVTPPQRTRLIIALKALGVETDEDQRAVVSTLVGRTVRSRSALTASEADAVLDVLAEEAKG